MNVLVIGAATMPLVIGSAAMALDTVQMSLWKRQLQRAADSAALAGAYAVVQEQDASPAVARDLQLNDDVPLLDAPVVRTPASGPYANNPRAVQVVLTTRRSLPFISFFVKDPPTFVAEATAASIFQGKYCMVSLEDGTSTGVTFTGNTNVTLGCGVISNSRAASAVYADGSARVQAVPVSAVGGVPSSGAYIQPTKLRPYSPTQPAPSAGLPRSPSPPAGVPCAPVLDVQPNRTVSVEPNSSGVYCFKGMDIQGTASLPPGTYYIDGSSLSVKATGILSGTGVTIILTSSTPTAPTSFATLSLHANAKLNLTSPTSGTYKGVLFYQDPRAPYGESIINGNSTSSFEGGFYFPSRQLKFNGTAGLETRCLQMVAQRLVFSGNSTVQNDCPITGGGQAFDATFVRLVA